MENDINLQHGHQQKVPYRRQRNAPSYCSGKTDKPEICDEKNAAEKLSENKTKKVRAGFQLPFGIGEMLEGTDSDKLLIIILLIMIYKDEGSSKLTMALVYLLI